MRTVVTLAILCVLSVSPGGCRGQRHLRLRVENQSSAVLKSVVAEFREGTVTFEAVAPGAVFEQGFAPSGETGVTVHAMTASGAVWSGTGGYVEPGYAGTIGVTVRGPDAIKVEDLKDVQPGL